MAVVRFDVEELAVLVAFANSSDLSGIKTTDKNWSVLYKAKAACLNGNTVGFAIPGIC